MQPGLKMLPRDTGRGLIDGVIRAGQVISGGICPWRGPCHVRHCVSPTYLQRSPTKSDWSERLHAAFADANLHSGFLPLAEQAIEACPGDPVILMLAATAALLDERPERALGFLKRFSKRASAPAEHLLHALALKQQNKRDAARAMLGRHGLASRWAAVNAFPGGSKRLPWLMRQLDGIVDERALSRATPRGERQGQAEDSAQERNGGSPGK